MAAAVPSVGDLQVTRATADDLQTLGKIINDAYEVETGDTGVAFKRTPRFESIETEFLPMIVENRVLKALDSLGQPLGCIVYQIHDDHVFFGPFAVDPAIKGRGVGKTLLAAVEAIAREHKAAYIEIDVINLRTDIIPMYEKMGFKTVGEFPYVHPDRATRPCHFIIMRRTLSY
jgi:ribosomal protein S18 acetylase RimI-like enzyme